MDFQTFLTNLNSEYPLNLKKTKGCFVIQNSGRRGDAKEFLLAYEEIISALEDIKNNISYFPKQYNEDIWRESSKFFTDNIVKSLCGVQTRPFFETINKIISWATESQYTEKTILLTEESLNDAISKLKTNFLKNDVVVEKGASLPLFSQTIYYGVPGCGKSHSISAKLRKLGILKSDECNFTKRVVFHPEYTNADFIGQILPETNEEKSVSYPFKVGPFTEILAQAYTHKNQNYALIIEEINRGNAAAIFGELFQLLDRLDKTENESSNGFTYTAGWSSYPVNNDNINKAIQEAYSKSDIEPFLPKEIFEKYKLNVGIRLPPNLSLLATMNTSDQNVFVLDNAFQRRWNMCLVPNVFSDTREEENQRNAILEGSLVTWETFQTKINQTIAQASKDSGFSSMVDKRLGCWFVKAEKNATGKFVISKESFKNKILKYLWDDAFKFDRENYFVDADSFEDLQSKVSMSEKNFGIFKEIEFTENSSKTEEKLESTD